jgi:CheY-like chemotaxis protein
LAAPLSKLSMLVVDDNTNMIQIVKTILKNFGVTRIFEATDVGEAFALVRAHPIDLVFLDYHLGFMDGIEFIRMMRTAPDSPNPFLPIIMLTAHTEQHRVEAARDAGATEFCAKPVTAAEIYRKIAEVIERPRKFVRAASYCGPDRRRHQVDFPGLERRRDRMAEIHADPVDTSASAPKAG